MARRIADEEEARATLEKLLQLWSVGNINGFELDFDHAGGLDDFPEAQVHLLADEAVAADSQRSWLDRNRFRPAQWGSRSRWVTYGTMGEKWHGFDSVRAAVGLDDEVLLVPPAAARPRWRPRARECAEGLFRQLGKPRL